MNAQEEIKYPDFEIIVKACIRKMKEAFSKYGNTWSTMKWNKQDWEARLEEEWAEVKQAENKYDEMEELIDVINIAAMRFTRLNEK
ncbi:MAG: hypothetical protein ACRD9Q_01225 [Nitrososphaeraceae archaeon]